MVLTRALTDGSSLYFGLVESNVADVLNGAIPGSAGLNLLHVHVCICQRRRYGKNNHTIM